MGESVKHLRIALGARVASSTPAKIKAIAVTLGYLYGGEGSIGKLLDAIASGKVLLVKVDNNDN